MFFKIIARALRIMCSRSYKRREHSFFSLFLSHTYTKEKMEGIFTSLELDLAFGFPL